MVSRPSQRKELTIFHRNGVDYNTIVDVVSVHSGIIRACLNIDGICRITCIGHYVYGQATSQRVATGKDIDRLVDVVHNDIGSAVQFQNSVVNQRTSFDGHRVNRGHVSGSGRSNQGIHLSGSNRNCIVDSVINGRYLQTILDISCSMVVESIRPRETDRTSD